MTWYASLIPIVGLLGNVIDKSVNNGWDMTRQRHGDNWTEFGEELAADLAGAIIPFLLPGGKVPTAIITGIIIAL
jgi:hypothetical protein